eukprot:Selendium_serpulae@DN773_c0_g1_i1.p2
MDDYVSSEQRSDWADRDVNRDVAEERLRMRGEDAQAASGRLQAAAETHIEQLELSVRLLRTEVLHSEQLRCEAQHKSKSTIDSVVKTRDATLIEAEQECARQKDEAALERKRFEEITLAQEKENRNLEEKISDLQRMMKRLSKDNEELRKQNSVLQSAFQYSCLLW